jgi:nitrite reductase/ring-hydroxylating ferredoxin subunit
MRSDTTGFWMPVALSADLPAGTVIPVRSPEGAIALWRSQSGDLAASADRCPHRGMSLSHGFVRGDVLSCIYHGWSYGMAGRCVRIPAHPGLTPPETIRVATHAVQEAHGVIWLASGVPETDPPALDGLIALRSLTVEAGLADIETAAGAPADEDGLIAVRFGGQSVCLLVSPQGESRTLVHLLLASDAGLHARIAAARGVETLRRTAERAAPMGNMQ